MKLLSQKMCQLFIFQYILIFLATHLVFSEGINGEETVNDDGKKESVLNSAENGEGEENGIQAVACKYF